MEPNKPRLRPSAGDPRQVEVHVKQSAPALLVMVFVAGFLLLVCAVLAAALVAVSVAAQRDPDPDRERLFRERLVFGARDARTKVLLLEVDGVIANEADRGLLSGRMGMVDRIDRMLRQAEEDPSVRALLLRINSPGGGITASDTIYHRLVEHTERTGVPVVALLGDVAASGGYYVAMAAERVIAHPTTITGSIGVIMPLVSMERLLGVIGIQPRPIKSADKKDIGAFYREITDEERAILEEMVEQMYARFLSVAEDGAERRQSRELTPERLRELADGRVLTGETAAENHLVSETGYFADALEAARLLADDPTAKLVRYVEQPRGLFDVLRGPAASRSGEITLRLDAPGWMRASEPMYLWWPGAPTLLSSGGGAGE